MDELAGTWQYDDDGAGGFNIGDAFTADYTYDSDSIIRADHSSGYYLRNLVDSVPLLSLVLNSGIVSHTFDFSHVSNDSYLTWVDLQPNPDYENQYGYKQAYLAAYDRSAPGFNRFQAYSYLGQDSDGSPTSGSYAQAYSSVSIYASSTNTYSTYRETHSGVTFSSLPPVTPVPTPALLPGLVGLGLGVVRKRKALAQPVLEEQKA